METEKTAIHEQIIFHLNSICGTNFKATTKDTKRHINARLKEGFTLQDFITVIEKKFFEWHNKPDFVQYLRPQTLFGTKFEGYLNQPKTNGNKAVNSQPNRFANFQQREWDFDSEDIQRLKFKYLEEPKDED